MASRVYEFGPYRLDETDKLLLNDGKAVPVTPKAVEVLLMLVAASEQVVTKEDLLRRVWADTFVDEGNLTQTIFMLRKAFGAGSYIQTVPRRGYRFTAPVRCVNNTAPSGPDIPARRLNVARDWRSAGVLVVGLCAGALVTAASLAWRAHAAPEHAIKSIAVLPLENLSKDPDQDYLAEGITDSVTTDLAQIGSLRVISRHSTEQYKQTHKQVSEIARRLHVDAIVEGTLVRDGNHVRVTAQLVSVSNGQNIWAAAYDRDLRDIVSLENEVARNVATSVSARLSVSEQKRLARSPSIDPQAREAYLKGRYFWNRRTEAGYLEAINYFRDAISRQPEYADAYAGLADTYALLGSMPNHEMPRREALPKAKYAAEKALAIDESLADAHTSLAFVKMHYYWDWQGASHEFERALELDPNSASAHQWFALDLIAMNRLDDGIAELRRARSLDPLSPIIDTDLAEALFYAGRYDDALTQAKEAIDLDPDFPLAHGLMERIYTFKHRFPDAIREGEVALRVSPGNRWARLWLAETFAVCGRVPEAHKIVRELEEDQTGSPTYLAGAYAVLGERTKMFAELNREYADRDGGLILLNYDWIWDQYRNDPRFKQLVRLVGLPSA